MSENPFQLILQAFGKVSECVQSHLSRFVVPSPSHPQTTNQNPLVITSSHSTVDSHLLQQPDGILKKLARSSSLECTQVTEFNEIHLTLIITRFRDWLIEEKKSSSPTTKEELGRATWTFLHTLAAQYPGKPTRQQKKDVKELMAILTRMYPCKECADHFKEVVRANPVQVGSHEEFSQWLCHAHNVVNRSLGKVIFPCERVDARWGKLECEQRACDLQGTLMDFGNETR